MNKHILEKLQIVSGVVPINLATGANDGDFVSLKGYGRCAVVFFAAAGVAAQDPTLVLEQAQDVANTGSNAKALDFTRVDTKQGAALTAVGTFTKVTQVANDEYTSDTAGETQQIWVVDIEAEMLDVDNGYDCIRARVADTGSTAKLGCMLYLLHDPRFNTDPLPSAIVD